MENEQIPAGAIPVNQFEAAEPSQLQAQPQQIPEGAIPVDQFESYESQFQTPGQTAIGLAEKFGRGLAGPVIPAIERGLGVSPEGMMGRAKALEEEHPYLAGAAELAGFAAPFVGSLGLSAAARAGLEAPELFQAGAKALSKYSQAGVLTNVGEKAAALAGLGGEGAGLVNKIGSKVVAGAVENALYTAGDIGSNIIMGQNPDEAAQSAIPAMTLSAVLGGALGGAFGAAGEAWKKAFGSDTGGILKTITNKLGGKETQIISDPVKNAMELVGIQPKPEIVAAMAEDPAIQRMAKALEQSDASGGGIAYQNSLKEFHQAAQEAIGNAFGMTPDEIKTLPEISKFESGKRIGSVLADEYSLMKSPVVQEFENIKSKYKGGKFVKDVLIPGDPIMNRPDEFIKGTASHIQDQLHILAQKEGWLAEEALPEIRDEMNRVLNALPKKQTLGDLTSMISQIGERTKSTLPFGQQTPLSRAGSLIKGVLRNAEDHLAIQHLGASEGPELVGRFRAAQAEYRRLSEFREALNDRLGVSGSTSGFDKGVRTMALTDGESLLKRMSGTNDAHLLEFLSNNFPRTAEAIKQYHLSNILEQSVNKAKPGELLNIGRLQTAIEKMSPEMRAFAIPKPLQNKLDGMAILQEQLNKVPHNFSNTARTSAVLNKYGIGTALGMVSLLTGHGVLGSIAAGQVAHTLSKTAPDAVRLGLLKFLGSDKAISAGGFKAMVDFIEKANKGESLMINATKNLFKAGSKVLPDNLLIDKNQTDKLDKQVMKFNNTPNEAFGMNGDLGHYLDTHGAAMSQAAMGAISYLNSVKPQPKKLSPLDPPIEPSKAEMTAYHRTLGIAQNPLMVVHYAKEHSLMPEDVKAVRTMYPAFYNKMCQQITHAMMDHTHEEKPVPYRLRQSLSLLMGQPLDATMTPQAIQSIQAMYASKGPQGPQNPPVTKNKRNTSKLGKMAENMLTQDQKAEQSHNKA